MHRPFSALLAFLALLSCLLIGIVAAHIGHLTTARAASPLPGASSPTQQQWNPYAGANGPRVIRFARNGEPAPQFLAMDLDGHIVSTADWKGKVALLNFWATWCPPCRDEIPMLIQLAKKYPDRLQVVGISMDDGPDDVKDFVAAEGINYPVVMWTREIESSYGGVPALPTSFLVDTEGRVVQKHVGLFPAEMYETEVRALLGLPVDATIQTFDDTGQIFLKNAERATELPDVDFTGLSAGQRRAALKRMNSESCNCGCRLTIAQCRINDTSCPVSKGLAAKIVYEILGGTPAHRPSSFYSPPGPN
jgi:thiol-disulfide isomerase/thioredoxin